MQRYSAVLNWIRHRALTARLGNIIVLPFTVRPFIFIQLVESFFECTSSHGESR